MAENITRLFHRPTDFTGTVWIVLIGLVGASALLPFGILARYGDWVYTEPLGRLALVAVFAQSAVLISAVGGALLWVAMTLLDRLIRLPYGAPALAVVLCASSLFWLRAMLVGKSPMAVYSNPGYLSLLGLGFFLAAVLGRGSRKWYGLDVLAIVLAGVVLAGVGSWLNLAYIRQSESLRSSLLNTAAWLVSYAIVAAATRGVRRVDGETEAARGAPHPFALLVLVVACGLAIVPVWRFAYRAGEPSESSSESGLGETAQEPAPGASSARIDSQKMNVILISLDTLRPDHLGIYGYDRPTSPNMDAFFSSGVLFTGAYSQAPWTLPTHMSMVTGQYPSRHGVRLHPAQTAGYVDRLPDSAVTVAEILGDAGYATGGFTGGAFVSSTYGFDQGFQSFHAAKSSRMEEALDVALPWLEENQDGPFFLFLHSYDIHRYDPPRTYADIPDDQYAGPLRAIAEEDPRKIELLVVSDGFYELAEPDIRFLEYLYDSEIRWVDDQLQRLFDALTRANLLERTAIIVTSDHGESFWEHSYAGHGFTLSDPVMRVPLIISVPGSRTGKRVESLVQTVDIAPTILEIAGQAPRRDMDGSSLMDALAGKPTEERALLLEADILDTQAALLSEGYKYVSRGIVSHNLLNPRFAVLTLRGLLSPYGRSEGLTSLAYDPGGREDPPVPDPEMSDRHRARLHSELRARRQARADSEDEPATTITDEEKENLRALGYLE